MPTLELSSFVAGSLPKLHLALVPNLKHHILRNSAIMDAKMQAETKEEGTHYESGEVSLFRGQEAELIPLVHTTRSFDLTFYILLQMVDLKQWRTPRIKIRWARLKIATRSRRFPGRADLHECRSPDICSPLEIGTAKEGLPSTLCFGADSRRQKQRSSYFKLRFRNYRANSMEPHGPRTRLTSCH